MPLIRHTSMVAAFAVAALLLPEGAPAASDSQSVPVQVIGGVVTIRGVVHTAQGDLQANFVLELGSARGLVVPPDRAAAMGMTAGGATSLTIGAARLNEVPVTEGTAAEIAGSLSMNHAAELTQIPVVGILGLGAFAGQPVTLDVGSQSLRIGAAAAAPGAATVVPLTPKREPLFSLDGVTVGLGMLQQESLVSNTAVDRLKLGRPDVAAVRLGAVDVLGADAFRIASMADLPEPRPDLRLGVRLLSNYRIAINPQEETATFELVRPPVPASAEQSFFLALHRRDAEGLATFLEQNPESRLATEGSIELLTSRLNQREASTESITKAIGQLAASFPPERRSRRLIGLADDLMKQANPKFAPVLREVLTIAAETASSDVDSRAIHDIHARQGALALQAGELREARRLLLSAAYGLPRDPQINAWMGDLYRKLNQPTRAWARYLQATLGNENPPRAVLRGLDEIGRDEQFRASTKIDDIELMLEGRVPAFVPPRARTPVQSPVVRLIELFTDDAGAGCVGPQLAFDGLRQFCGGTPTAFLAFHFGPAGNSSLSGSRARFYGRASLPATLGDGQVLSEVAAGPKDAPALFDSLVTNATAIDAPPSPAPAVTLTATAAWEGSNLRSTLELHATNAQMPVGDLRLFAFVVERRVFAVGGNGAALHYQVARAAIGELAGEAIALAPQTGSQSWNLTLTGAALRASAEQGEAARARQNASAPAMRTVTPQPGECGVVAFVQDVKTKRVHAVATLSPADIGGAR